MFKTHFKSHEHRKAFIREFAATLRENRKNAVETGNEEQTKLDEERLIAFLMIFKFCPFVSYRKQVGDVLIEGLKYQQRTSRNTASSMLRNAFLEGFSDIGWWMKLLNKKYVSKYAWKLLRINAESIALCARVALKDAIIFWSKDEVTQKKWHELDEEFGTHFDFVAEFSR